MYSAVQVQKIAHCAFKDLQASEDDDVVFPDMRLVAKCGSWGRNTPNIHRDLGNVTQTPLQEYVDTVPLPVKGSGVTGGWRTAFQDMLLPHEMFAAIFKHYPEQFRQRILPDTTRLHEFWDEMQSHPQMLGHPVQERTDYKNKCIPISLHGDGVPVAGVGKAWHKSMDAWSWCSLLGTGSTLDFNLYIYALYDQCRSKLFGHNTEKVFFF